MQVYTSRYLVKYGAGLAVIAAYTVEEASDILCRRTHEMVKGLQYDTIDDEMSYKGILVDDWGEWDIPELSSELHAHCNEAKVLHITTYAE